MKYFNFMSTFMGVLYCNILDKQCCSCFHLQIFVVGPAGCGKSECIKTFAVAERERGKTISVQTVFSKAVESEELIGYFDPKTKYVSFLHMQHKLLSIDLALAISFFVS